MLDLTTHATKYPRGNSGDHFRIRREWLSVRSAPGISRVTTKTASSFSYSSSFSSSSSAHGMYSISIIHTLLSSIEIPGITGPAILIGYTIVSGGWSEYRCGLVGPLFLVCVFHLCCWPWWWGNSTSLVRL